MMPRVVCLTGDVMTGRGVDQLFAWASKPMLHEPAVRDAGEYVALAEARSGRIAKPVGPGYVWGDALAALDRAAPDARVINLETAVTDSDDYERGKQIHYRMHPANAACLTSARIDVCGLANNHVLDWGRTGLAETLETLKRHGMRVAGAGPTRDAAEAPAIVPLVGGGRLLVFAAGSTDSGIPASWAAGARRPGVGLLPDLSRPTAEQLSRRAEPLRRPGDLVVVSMHWGSNWGYEVPRAHVDFAHALVDGGVDVVHGHSSHHPRPIEVYRERLILYGCGDFINDYEGITGYESYRGDLVVLYVVSLDAASGRLEGLKLAPFRLERLRLTRPGEADVAWLRDTMDDICAPFGVRVTRGGGAGLEARWT